MKKLILPVALIVTTLLALLWLVTRGYPGTQSSTPSSNSNQNTNNTPAPTQAPAFDKTAFATGDPSSIWVVVNKQRPLEPKNYVPLDLVSVGGSQQLRKEAAEQLIKMIADARTAGLGISPLSGYRSYNTQVTVYNNEVATNGQTVADTQSARPGHSEHQTGLAIDVGGGGCGIEDCFGETAVGKWVAANAYKYGYIIRYTTGKEVVTGYRAEPWHIRYVGIALSTELHGQQVSTLEEFFALPPAPNY